MGCLEYFACLLTLIDVSVLHHRKTLLQLEVKSLSQAAWLDTKSCCKIACAVTESHWRDNSPNHMLWAKWSDALSASLLFLDHMVYFLSQISLYTILVAEDKPFCYFSKVLKSDLFDRCGKYLWRHYLYAWFQTKQVLEVDLGLLCTNNIGGN